MKELKVNKPEQLFLICPGHGYGVTLGTTGAAENAGLSKPIGLLCTSAHDRSTGNMISKTVGTHSTSVTTLTTFVESTCIRKDTMTIEVNRDPTVCPSERVVKLGDPERSTGPICPRCTCFLNALKTRPLIKRTFY